MDVDKALQVGAFLYLASLGAVLIPYWRKQSRRKQSSFLTKECFWLLVWPEIFYCFLSACFGLSWMAITIPEWTFFQVLALTLAFGVLLVLHLVTFLWAHDEIRNENIISH